MRQKLRYIIMSIGLIGAISVLPIAYAADCTTAKECANSAVTEAKNPTSTTTVGGLLQTISSTLLFIVGALSVIMIIVGGIKYVISQGDSSAVSSAKNTILYSIVGLVVAVIAYAIVNFVIFRLNNATTSSVASTTPSGGSGSSSSGSNGGSAISSTTGPDTIISPKTPAAPAPAPTTPTAPSAPTTSGSGTYKDGSYSASASYDTPGGTNSINCTLQIQSDKVSSVSCTHSTGDSKSASYVSKFDAAVDGAVNGQSLGSLSPSRVGGASLTTDGFNEVINSVRSKA